MPMFRKRPVVIEARQFVADPKIEAEVRDFVAEIKCRLPERYSEDLTPYVTATRLARWCGGDFIHDAMGLAILIPTLEGEMRAGPGDWIIKGVKGEFYPCKPDVFAAVYEPEGEA